jgi:hypothetical protein
MKQQLLLFMLVIAGFLALAARSCPATEPYAAISTYSFQFLNYSTGARNIALGQVGTADDNDPSNQYYNPAVLVSFEGIGLCAGTVEWIAHANYDDYGIHAGRRFTSGDSHHFRLAGALRYTTMELPAQEIYTIFIPHTGITLDPQDKNVTLALAGGWGTEVWEIGAGFSVKRISSELSDAQIRAWAFDLGVLAKAKIDLSRDARLLPCAGFSFVNLGSGTDHEDRSNDLPRQWRAGLGLRFEVSRLELGGRDVSAVSMAGVADYVDDRRPYPNKFGAGIELGFIDTVYLRTGYMNTLDDTANGLSSRGVGLAWSIRRLRLALDYAYHEVHYSYNSTEAYSGSAAFSF